MKKRISNLILVLIFLLGFGILMYPIVANWWNSKVQSSAIINYDAIVRDMAPEDYSDLFEEADRFNKMLAGLEDPLNHVKELPPYPSLLAVGDSDVMAYLTINRLKVEIPVYHGTSDAVLNEGAGHMEGTSLPVGGIGTHAALSAHRGLPSSKLFSDLDQMEVGDKFTIKVLDRLMTYQVDQIKVVLPHEMEELAIDPDHDYVTLVTCTPYGINTHRLLVRGTRVENEEIKEDVYVPNDAVKVDPLIVTPIVAIPLLVLMMIGVAIKYRKKK